MCGVVGIPDVRHCRSTEPILNHLCFIWEFPGFALCSSDKSNVNLLKPTGYVMHQQFNLLKLTGYVMHQHFNLLKPTGYVMHHQFNLLKTNRTCVI